MGVLAYLVRASTIFTQPGQVSLPKQPAINQKPQKRQDQNLYIVTTCHCPCLCINSVLSCKPLPLYVYLFLEEPLILLRAISLYNVFLFPNWPLFLLRAASLFLCNRFSLKLLLQLLSARSVPCLLSMFLLHQYQSSNFIVCGHFTKLNCLLNIFLSFLIVLIRESSF